MAEAARPPLLKGVRGSAALRFRSHPPPKSTHLGFRVLLPPSLPPSHGGKFHAGGCLRRASTICQSTPPSPPLRKGGDPCGRTFSLGSGLGFALPRVHNSQICSAAHFRAGGLGGLGVRVWALPCRGRTTPRFAQRRTSSRAVWAVSELGCRWRKQWGCPC